MLGDREASESGRTRDWRPSLTRVVKAALSQDHHHRAPVGKRRLEQVQADEHREPQKRRAHIHAEQHAQHHKSTGNQTERTFDGHDQLLSTVCSVGRHEQDRVWTILEHVDNRLDRRFASALDQG